MRHTKATREKLSRMRRGKRNPFFGKTHTAATKRRMSEWTRRRNLAATYEPAPQAITVPSGSDLAYLAGMIDADGSIRFRRDHSTSKKTRRPFVAVYNTNMELMRWLKKKLGHGSLSKANMGRKQVVQWCISGARDVHALAKALLPHLIVKRSDARVAVRFIERKYGWEK